MNKKVKTKSKILNKGELQDKLEKAISILAPLLVLVIFIFPNPVFAQGLTQIQNMPTVVENVVGNNKVIHRMKVLQKHIDLLNYKEFSELFSNIYFLTFSSNRDFSKVFEKIPKPTNFHFDLSKAYAVYNQTDFPLEKAASLMKNLSEQRGELSTNLVKTVLALKGGNIVFNLAFDQARRMAWDKFLKWIETQNRGQQPLPPTLPPTFPPPIIRIPKIKILTSIGLAIAAWLGITNNGDLPFPGGGPIAWPKKKVPQAPTSWLTFFQESLQNSLIFLMKNPQYIILVLICYIFREKISGLFHENKRQQIFEEAQNSADKIKSDFINFSKYSIEKIDEYGKIFKQLFENSQLRERENSLHIEGINKKSREETEKLIQKLHETDIKVIQCKNVVDNCNDEYQKLFLDNQFCQNTFDSTIDSIKKNGGNLPSNFQQLGGSATKERFHFEVEKKPEKKLF